VAVQDRTPFQKELAEEIGKLDQIINLHKEISLEQLSDSINLPLMGRMTGRTVVTRRVLQ
jgi:hypothetical protein